MRDGWDHQATVDSSYCTGAAWLEGSVMDIKHSIVLHSELILHSCEWVLVPQFRLPIVVEADELVVLN